MDQVQLTLSNIRTVGEWIRSEGGATAGMQLITTGDIGARGLRLGTLEGGVLTARVGDWIIRIAGEGFHVEHGASRSAKSGPPAGLPRPSTPQWLSGRSVAAMP